MAGTQAGRQLTENHRLAQARVGALAVVALRRAWPLLDAAHVDTTVELWLTAATGIVRQHRQVSAQLAAAYQTTFRTIEAGPDPSFAVIPLGEVATPVLTTSLMVTGPVALRTAVAQGVPVVQAARTAESQSATAGMRHALNGGRDTVLTSIANDPAAAGYQRVPSSSCCAFCAALAIRGPVFHWNGDFHAHDSCHCTAEAVYDRYRHQLPPGVSRLRDIYNESTADVPGPNRLNEFRKALAAAN